MVEVIFDLLRRRSIDPVDCVRQEATIDIRLLGRLIQHFLKAGFVPVAANVGFAKVGFIVKPGEGGRCSHEEQNETTQPVIKI